MKTIEVNGVFHQVEEHNVLVKGRVMVEWVEAGEGLSGDYDPEDPEDIELLRFYVSYLNDEGEWVDPGDASCCTRMPVSASPEIRREGLELIMSEVYEPLVEGKSIKKICERLSWIGIDWFKEEGENG